MSLFLLQVIDSLRPVDTFEQISDVDAVRPVIPAIKMCLFLGECLYYVFYKVYGCMNVHFTTAVNIEAPP